MPHLWFIITQEAAKYIDRGRHRHGHRQRIGQKYRDNKRESRLGPITVERRRISSDLLLLHSVTLVGCTFPGQGSAAVW